MVASSAPGPHDDPGLQPERTHLAWSRTTLAFGTMAVLTVRLGIQADVEVLPVVLVLAGTVLAVVRTGRRRHRRHVLAIRNEVAEPATPAVLGLGLGTVVLGVIALALLVG